MRPTDVIWKVTRINGDYFYYVKVFCTVAGQRLSYQWQVSERDVIMGHAPWHLTMIAQSFQRKMDAFDV